MIICEAIFGGVMLQRSLIFVVILVVGLSAIVFWHFRRPGAAAIAPTGLYYADDGVSTNLDQDLVTMWEIASVPNDPGTVSTHEAQLAASRVFNTVNLIGMPRSEV